MEARNYHVQREYTTNKNPATFQVRDREHTIVCECEKLHNAQLIAKLLEKYS